jgi:hypothetical protein
MVERRTWIFIALFIIAKKWKYPKFLLTDKWINLRDWSGSNGRALYMDIYSIVHNSQKVEISQISIN